MEWILEQRKCNIKMREIYTGCVCAFLFEVVQTSQINDLLKRFYTFFRHAKFHTSYKAFLLIPLSKGLKGCVKIVKAPKSK